MIYKGWIGKIFRPCFYIWIADRDGMANYNDIFKISDNSPASKFLDCTDRAKEETDFPAANLQSSVCLGKFLYESMNLVTTAIDDIISRLPNKKK